jgi:hypothetical protein
MTWTKSKPADTGWYWFRTGDGLIQRVVNVSYVDGNLVCEIPEINFHGRLEDFEKRLIDFNELRRHCEMTEIVRPEWSDERVPIPHHVSRIPYPVHPA